MKDSSLRNAASRLRPPITKVLEHTRALSARFVGKRIVHDCGGGVEICYVAVAVVKHYGRDRILARPVCGRGLSYLGLPRCRIVEENYGDVWTEEEIAIARDLKLVGFVGPAEEPSDGAE